MRLVTFATLALCAILACAVEHWLYLHAKYERTRYIASALERRLTRLEERGHYYEFQYQVCADKVAELQEWRGHITTASRMGWQQANRYISEYPLESHYVYVRPQ